MKKQCNYCKTDFVGRADKKYCDSGCRSAYNNQVNGARNNYMRLIDIRLKRNRRILLTELREGQVTISTLDLIDRGFDFKFSTHTSLEDAKVQYWCYDVGFSENETSETLLDIITEGGFTKEGSSFD